MNIKTDILNYYMHELTSEELANFDNLTEENIRLIVNRIWHNFLSSDFKLGESYIYQYTSKEKVSILKVVLILKLSW